MIPESVFELMHYGNSMVVGTCDAQGIPECTRAFGMVASPDRNRITFFLTEAPSRRTLENLKNHKKVAITFSVPTDHRAAQIKGTVVGVRAPTDEELEIQRTWAKRFRCEVVPLGIIPEALESWIIAPFVAVDLLVEEVYSHTPGPGAGAKL